MTKFYFGYWKKHKERGWIWHEISILKEKYEDAFKEFKSRYGKELYKGHREGIVAQVLTWK